MTDPRMPLPGQEIESSIIPREEEVSIPEKSHYHLTATIPVPDTITPTSVFSVTARGRIASIDTYASSAYRLYSYALKADKTGFEGKEVAKGQYGKDTFELLEDGSMLSASGTPRGQEINRFVPQPDGSFKTQFIGLYETPPPRTTSIPDRPLFVRRYGEGIIVVAGREGLNFFSQRADGTFERSIHSMRDLTAREFRNIDKIDILSDGRFVINEHFKISVLDIRPDGKTVTYAVETFNNQGVRKFVPTPDGSFYVVNGTGEVNKYVPKGDGHFSKVKVKVLAEDLQLLGGDKVFLRMRIGGTLQGGVFTIHEDGSVIPDSDTQFESKNGTVSSNGRIINVAKPGKLQIIDGDFDK